MPLNGASQKTYETGENRLCGEQGPGVLCVEIRPRRPYFEDGAAFFQTKTGGIKT